MRNLLFDSIVDYLAGNLDDETTVCQARFRSDFGPWKRGHIANRLVLDMEHGMLAEIDELGNVAAEQSVKLALGK